MKTNLKLVEFAKKALAENWGYCLGTYGNILTPSLLQQKMSQGYGVGAYNTKHKLYLNKFIGKRVSDCYGLIKGFVWWNDGNVKYNAQQDRNQEGAFSAAKEKGVIANIPEIPGLILWMKGHAGIYIGNGEFIECVGAPVGVRKGKIVNGKVISGSKFTHWFKDTYIDYVKTSETFVGLRLGNKGERVKKLQQNLKSLGYILAVDGSFGQETRNIVTEFQKDMRIKVDGIAGKETHAHIDIAIKNKGQKLNKLTIDYHGKKIVVNGIYYNNTNCIPIDILEELGCNVNWVNGNILID